MVDALYPSQPLSPNAAWLGMNGSLAQLAYILGTNDYTFSLADRLAAGLPLGYGGSVVGESPGGIPLWIVSRVARRYGLSTWATTEPLGGGGTRMMADANSPQARFAAAWAKRRGRKAT